MSIDEIKSRLETATPGPWKANDDGTIDGPEYAEVIYRGPVDCMSNCYGGTSVIEGDNLKPDAEFIAHAPEDVRRLLNAVEAVFGLHQPFEWSFGYGPVQSCKECADRGMSQKDAEYPCPTVKAITSALEAS